MKGINFKKRKAMILFAEMNQKALIIALIPVVMAALINFAFTLGLMAMLIYYQYWNFNYANKISKGDF